jgi:alkylation response protein AidB-like acyl-CoA dehydrogenase
VNFDATREHQMLRRMVRDFVERECPKAYARELELSEEYPAELARRIGGPG